MVKYYMLDQENLIKTENIKDSFWIYIEDPSEEELLKHSELMDIDLDDLKNSLDMNEISRVEFNDNYLFFILRVPIYSKMKEIKFYTEPIGIFLYNNKVLTVCSSNNNVFNYFMGVFKLSLAFTPYSFILNVLNRNASLYLKMLTEINRRTGQIEKELQQSMKNKELIRLLNLEKSLVFFTTSLRSNEIITRKLRRNKAFSSNEDLVEQIDDVLIEIKQAMEMADIYSNILSGMMDAFASIISNNLNIVMKFLALITIVLQIPTLIFSFGGMNYHLPWQGNPFGALYLSLISIVLAIILIIIFHYKKFL